MYVNTLRMNHFPSINENNRSNGLFEINSTSSSTSNSTSNSSSNQDFSEQIDIEVESISLALRTLSISKLKYNEMNINELKELRRIYKNNNYAINILIYYKQNSTKYYFPQISLIYHNIIKQKKNLYENEKYAKIYPEI